MDDLIQIFSNPEKIKNQAKDFWKSTTPYNLTLKLADWDGTQLDLTEFKQIMSQLEVLSTATRENHRYIQLAKSVVASKDTFLEKGLKHICSYLPEGTQFDSIIHLVAFIPQWAFSWDKHQIINVSAQKWNGEANKILNLLVHEIYHQGFGIYSSGKAISSIQTVDDLREQVLWQLQNEGMATYVAHSAKGLFPFDSSEEDYSKLENPKEVEIAHNKLSEIFSVLRSPMALSSIQKIQTLGVDERAFYIFGSHMAKSIKEKFGRPVLIETILEGPSKYISLYNKSDCKNLCLEDN